jgi:hypothetical protein
MDRPTDSRSHDDAQVEPPADQRSEIPDRQPAAPLIQKLDALDRSTLRSENDAVAPSRKVDSAEFAPDSNLDSVDQRARQIADGHAYDKHVVEGGEFPEVGSRGEFAAHISEVMRSPSASQPLERDRTAYYSDDAGTIVIEDPQHLDGGTCFRPADGRAYYDRIIL